MLAKMKLQLMRRDHLAHCARLYTAVFNSPPWKGKWTTKTAATHIRESFKETNFRGIVALEGREIVAFAYGLISHWENERHFYLKEMCVLSRKQGTGVGTHLLTRFMEKLKAEKVSRISLSTEHDKPAADFYRRLGFEIEPKIIVMSKRLRRLSAK